MKEKVWGKENRVKLYKVLPLETPFTLIIGASSACNFKCKYCIHSLSDEELKKVNFNSSIMDYEQFKKVIDDVAKFPDRIKTLQFLKDGEPLMNKKLPDMIQYAKKSNKFEKIEIITNGVLLTPELNIKLIDAGLDTLRISLQGLSKEKYLEMVGVNVDFKAFLKNIEHFYRNKNSCKLHLKMIDIGIGKNKEEFFRMFKDICDEVSIQYTAPFYDEYIDYSGFKKDFSVDLYGEKLKKVEVCPRPFISISVSADGSITPCCRENTPGLILGNAKSDSVFDIWNGEKLKNFRIMQLSRKRHKHDSCRKCCFPDATTYDSDNLDEHIDEIYKFYS